MLVDVLGDEPVLLRVDVPGARGELDHQLFRHRRHRPRRVPVPAHLADLPPHAEGASQVIGEHGLVQLGQRDRRGVHRPAVEGAPLAVQDGLHLVADDHVRVQMGVARAGVVVAERRGDQTPHVDLRNGSIAGGCAGAGGCNLPFHERNHLRNRRMVRVRDQCLRARIRDRPEHGG